MFPAQFIPHHFIFPLILSVLTDSQGLICRVSIWCTPAPDPSMSTGCGLFTAEYAQTRWLWENNLHSRHCYGAALNLAVLLRVPDLSPKAGGSQRRAERPLALNQFIPGESILQHPAVPESPPKHRHVWIIARCWNGWLRNNSVPQLLRSTINHYRWLNNTKRD